MTTNVQSTGCVKTARAKKRGAINIKTDREPKKTNCITYSNNLKRPQVGRGDISI